MFTTQLISYPESIVTASAPFRDGRTRRDGRRRNLGRDRRPALAGSAGHSTDTVPAGTRHGAGVEPGHVAPAWAKAAPTGRVSFALAPSPASSTRRRPLAAVGT